MSGLFITSSFLLAASLLSGNVESEGNLADSPDLFRVYGGAVVAPCAWPTTVSMSVGCTGTLVHPELVISAAHCGGGSQTVTFGDNANGGAARNVQATCTTNPSYSNSEGNDISFCKLSQPQTDIPIVPILMGSDEDILQGGKDTQIVGYGNNDIGQPFGTKIEVTAPFNMWTDSEGAFVGGNGVDSCQGDSGGPIYVQMDDGTWRVFGITSWGGECGTGGYYGVMSKNIAWVEENSGIDVTPCHDADGTWNPGPDCGDIPTDPGAGGGDWSNGCAGGGTAPHTEGGMGTEGGSGGGDEGGDTSGGEDEGGEDTGEDAGGEDTGAGTGDTGSDDVGGEGSGTGDGEDDGGTGITTLGEEEEDEEGCNCRTDNKAAPASGLALLGLLFFLRRRKKA